MNILYLNTTYQCGGAERVVSQLFQGMQKRGHQVYQIVSYDKKHSQLPANVYVIYPSLPMRIFNRLITGNHGNQSLHIWYSRRYIMRFIKKHHIDLVHLHNPHDNFLGILDIADIAKMRPMIWTLHDFWAMTGHCAYPYGCDDRWKNGCPECPCLNNYPAIRKDTAHRLFCQKSTAYQNSAITFTVPSDWMKQQFDQSHLSGNSCLRIYNSVDVNLWKAIDKQVLRQKYNIEPEKRIIAFIASDPEKKLKGMPYLIQALESLPNPENYLLIVAGKVSSNIAKLNNHFKPWHWGYLDSQEKLNDFYSLADVLITPSVYETFGLTTVEAMVCGTPVIAFPVCAMPEIIDETCGWIASDVSNRSLLQTIQIAFSDHDLLLCKGKNCRKWVENRFSENTMLAEFESIYEKLIFKFNGKTKTTKAQTDR